MRFVVRYTVGDGCTYGVETSLPVEYSSLEAFYVDFEDAIYSAMEAKVSYFVLAGHEWRVSDFTYYAGGPVVVGMPEVLTLDEWYGSVPNIGVGQGFSG